MTADEWAIRDTAKTLAGLYRELDAAKYAKTRQPEVRSMRPAPGPRSPAPDHLISLDTELSGRLMEMVGECRTHVSPTRILHKDGARLSGFVAWHAQSISELDVAADLLEEMKDQIRQLKHKLQPRDIDQVANRPEPRHTSGIIIDRLASKGYKVTQEQLRQWAYRKHISSELRKDGRATYRISEVLAHINRPVRAKTRLGVSNE